MNTPKVGRSKAAKLRKQSGRIWVGIKSDSTREVFRAINTPTEATHGNVYSSAIGPFRTMRGALFMAQYGAGNPHVQRVADAERIAASQQEVQ